MEFYSKKNYIQYLLPSYKTRIILNLVTQFQKVRYTDPVWLQGVGNDTPSAALSVYIRPHAKTAEC